MVDMFIKNLLYAGGAIMGGHVPCLNGRWLPSIRLALGFGLMQSPSYLTEKCNASVVNSQYIQ